MNTCLTCKKDFLVKKSTTGKYCGRECYWNSKKRRKDYACSDCGVRVSPVKSVRSCRECMGKRMTREGHWNWKTDRSSLAKKQERGDSSYKEWRTSVWRRDSFKCRMQNADCKGNIEAHHILPWAQFENLRYDTNNGITLCHLHHPRRRIDEVNLAPFFQRLVINETTP